MRIRQIKPAFWQDAKIAAMPADSRLFYIGLWQMADDDGWLRWDVSEIGGELYRFESRTGRERRVLRMAEDIVLMDGGHKLVIYECGHAQLPRLAIHQHLAGTTRRVTAIHDEHTRCAPPANPRDSSRDPATPRISPPRVGVGVGVGKGNGSYREVTGKGGVGGESDVSKKETTERATTVREESADPDADRKARIARAVAIINDPSKSEAMRQVAHDELNRLQAVA